MTDDPNPTDTDVPEAPLCLPRLRRGKAFFEADSMARLGLHIKRNERALIAAKTEALKPFGLPVAQYAVLAALYYHPGQSSAQLARTAAVTPQTMASVLARLEDKKLISRTPSEAHAKVLLTSLTKEGEELVLQADEQAPAPSPKTPLPHKLFPQRLILSQHLVTHTLLVGHHLVQQFGHTN